MKPRIRPPPKMATSSGLFLATIYNQSQLAERKPVARYWLINTAATAVPLSAHPSPLVITTKLAAAILSGPLFARSCSAGPVLPLWNRSTYREWHCILCFCWLAMWLGRRLLQIFLCIVSVCSFEVSISVIR